MVTIHRNHPDLHYEPPRGLFARLAHEPGLANALFALGDALYARLDGRAIDVVSMRVAVLAHNLYMWRGHVRMSLRRGTGCGGMTPDEICRVAAGPDHLDGRDRVLAQAVDDLLTLNRLGGATRQALGDLETAIELAIGFYEVISRRASGLEPDAAAIAGLETPAIAASGVGR